MSFFDELLTGKRLQQVCSKHSGTSLRQAAKLLNEAVPLIFSFPIYEDLQFKNGLWLDNEKILQFVPLDAETAIVKFVLIIIFKVGD